MRIAICGSRSFHTMNQLRYCMNQLASRGIRPTHIMSYSDPAVVELVARFAASICVDMEQSVDDMIGTSARNELMLDNSDGVLILWDGVAKEGQHMQDICRRDNKPHWVFRYHIGEFTTVIKHPSQTKRPRKLIG